MPEVSSIAGLYERLDPTMTAVSLELKNHRLWKQFHGHTTEMIITKSGRRMFPALRVCLRGLEPDAMYLVLLEARLADDRRYKFSGGSWTPVGPADPQPPPSTRIYLQSDSPATGAHIMEQDVLFVKAKLTNNTLDRSRNLVLTSMHKYQPVVHVVQTSDLTRIPWSPTASFLLPDTEFIAVTAYQNEKITELKIDHNPFAKAFRENGQARTKRKLQKRDDQDPDKNSRTDSELEHSKGESSGEEGPPQRVAAKKSYIKSEDDSGISVCSASPTIEEYSDHGVSSSIGPLQPTSPHRTGPIPSSPLAIGPMASSPLGIGPRLLDLPPPPPCYPPVFWPYHPYLMFPQIPLYHPSLLCHPMPVPPLPPLASSLHPPLPHLELIPRDYSVKN